MVTEGHIITCLFRQSLFIIFSCFHQSIEIYFGNPFEVPGNKILFCIYHVLHLAILNVCPSVTGNGGTIFTPLQIIILQTFFTNLIILHQDTSQKAFFCNVSTIYVENAY